MFFDDPPAQRSPLRRLHLREVNIFDKRPDPAYRTGAIVNVAKPLAMVNAGGKWNTLEITAKGPKMTVVLNGVTTVRDAEDTKFARGPIALQYGGGSGEVQERADSSYVTDIGCSFFQAVPTRKGHTTDMKCISALAAFIAQLCQPPPQLDNTLPTPAALS